MSNKEEIESHPAVVLSSWILGITIAIPVIVAESLIRGLALNLVWGWVITPSLELPELTFAASVGIVALVRLFRIVGNKEEKKAEKLWSNTIGNLFLVPLMVILIGFIASLFI